VLIDPRVAKSPGSGRTGVIGALVYFFPYEAVLGKLPPTGSSSKLGRLRDTVGIVFKVLCG